MQVGYTGAEPSRLRRASALRRTDVQIAVRIGVQTARPRPGLAPPYLCCIAIERHSHVACSPSAPRVACATRLVTLGNLLKPAARPDCCVARCSESSCTRMYTAVPAPHMEVQVSREAGCRKRPLRAPCTRALRDQACCAGCAFPSPLRGSLGRAARDGCKRFPLFHGGVRGPSLCLPASTCNNTAPRSEEHTSELQ